MKKNLAERMSELEKNGRSRFRPVVIFPGKEKERPKDTSHVFRVKYKPSRERPDSEA